MVCDFTFFSKFSTRKKVQSSFCHKNLWHFHNGVQLGLTYSDHKSGVPIGVCRFYNKTGFEGEVVVNDSPVDCQSHGKPSPQAGRTLSFRPPMTKLNTYTHGAVLVIFVFIRKLLASAEKSALAFFYQVQCFLKTHANLYCKF